MARRRMLLPLPLLGLLLLGLVLLGIGACTDSGSDNRVVVFTTNGQPIPATVPAGLQQAGFTSARNAPVIRPAIFSASPTEFQAKIHVACRTTLCGVVLIGVVHNEQVNEVSRRCALSMITLRFPVSSLAATTGFQPITSRRIARPGSPVFYLVTGRSTPASTCRVKVVPRMQTV